MFNFLLANVFLEINSPPLFKKELCLNYRGSAMSCRRCAESCPAKAALLTERFPSFDRTLCRGCGTCAAACISGALVMADFPWHKLLEEARSANELTLGCNASVNSTFKIPCLGGLSGELLAAITLLRRKRPFSLDLSSCVDCSSRLSLQQMWRSLEAGRQKLGYNLPVRFLFTQSENKMNDLTTRRKMLQNAGKELLLLSEQMLNKNTDKKWDAPQRTYLLTAAMQLNNTMLTFPTWNIKDLCTGCGRCQSVCPHKAWQLTVSDGFIEVWHYPGRCSGCALCENSCPSKAKIKDQVTMQAEWEKPQLKHRIRALYCSRCKLRLVTSQRNNSLCPVCKKKKRLEINAFKQVLN